MKDAWFPIAGIVVGIASSFSGLGGGFLVVPLLIALGFPAQRAVGTAFAAILPISISALFGHSRLAEVDWKVGILIGLGGIIGTQVGPRLLQGVSQAVFQRLFAGILLGLALWMFFKR
jgi:uncharacterized membrane protein YfcA